MRKITISVAALLAINAIQAQAVTKTWDFSGVTEKKSSPITDYEIDGLFVTLESSNSNHINTGELRFNKDGDYAKFTAEGNGTVTVKFKANGDVTGTKPRWIAVGTNKKSDSNSNLTTELAKATCLGGEMGEKAVLKTLSVDVTAGSTIYIYNAGGCTVTNITYEYTLPLVSSDAFKNVELTIKKGKKSASTDLTLQAGTYIFTAPEGCTLAVKEAAGLQIDNNTVVVGANNTKVTVTLTCSKEVSADTKKTFKYAIDAASLAAVKGVYTQKIAVMINKANEYTNDERLQACAVEASKLMATANGMGLERYDEYKLTGKIAALDAGIASLSTKIDNAKAAYDGYAYAQEKLGMAYSTTEAKWVEKADLTGTILGKKKELDEVYKAAQTSNAGDAAALAALKEVYDNAIKNFDNFVKTIDSEYAAGSKTDLAAYKTEIDTRVGSVKTDEVAASGVMGTLDEAKSAIQNGDDNALSHADVNGSVASAKTIYDAEAGKLYDLLADNKDYKDGDTYRDMYLEALGKLNEYLRIINEVKAENEALFEKKECTSTTKATLTAKLVGIIGSKTEKATIDTVFTYYQGIANILRAYYAAANNDIKNNLTGYLKTNIKDVIGKRTEVLNYYNTAIQTIETKISTLQGKVDDANAKHIIKGTSPYCEGYEEDYAAIRADVDAIKDSVVTSAAEWDAWTASKAVVNDLQTEYNNQKNGNKDHKITGVTKTVSKDKVYSQATKFSVEYEATIQQRITDLLNAVNAAFKADGTGTSRVFNTDTLEAGKTDENDKVTLYGSEAIKANIKGYAADAKACMDKYEAVVEALASYNVALNGKPAEGEEGKDGYKPADLGLKDVATNLDVIIYGESAVKTYRQYISEIEAKIGSGKDGLKGKLNAAVLLNDTAHVKAMEDLTTFDDLVADINAKQEAYGDNATKWNKEQLEKAKKNLLAEATRRVGVINTQNAIANDNYTDSDYNTVVDTENKNTNVTYYETATYGKWIDNQPVLDKDGNPTTDKDGNPVMDKGLATLLSECNAAVKAISEKIANAEENADDAKAIAVLSEVVDDLTAAEAKYKTLSEKASSVKAAYTAEKLARKELLEEITKEGGLNESLAKVTFEKVKGTNYFADEVYAQNTAINNYRKAVGDNFKAETVVANKETLTKKQNAISTAIKNLQGLVAEEVKNKTADEDFEKKDAEVNITTALSVASEDITNAVNDKKATADSPAYNYYTALLTSYSNKYSAIKAERTTAFGEMRRVYADDKKKTILAGALDKQKYTDPSKNMTAKGESLKDSLTTLKGKIVLVAGDLIACETEYAAQKKAWDDLGTLRSEVFSTITSAETSSYHDAALAELKVIDAEIAAYKTAIDSVYNLGANSVDKVELEAMATTANTKLVTLKNGWNDEYTKAVAADNLVRKQAFDAAYSSLTAAYAYDVDVIARLSKLSYADGQGGVLSEVVGENGIYSYADNIRDLKSRAEAAYSAAVAPTLFDGGEKFKAEAAQFQKEVNEMTTKYTQAVNGVAKTTYDTERQKANAALDNAKKAVKNTLGDANVSDAFFKEQFSDVQDIIKNAESYAEQDKEGNYKNPDFAEILDKTILPSFATIDSKIVADKENAAVKSYNDRLQSYRTLANSEAKLIAGYNGEDGTLGKYSEAYAEFIKGSLDAAEATWALIAEGKKFENYKFVPEKGETTVYAALDEFGTPRVHPDYNKDDKTQPAEYKNKHTEKFWTAFDADQKYHANDNAYDTMLTYISDVQEALDNAEEFVASLIIRNNTGVTDRLAIAQNAINKLESDASDYHTDNAAKDNLDTFNKECQSAIEDIKAITNNKSGALSTERTAVDAQIGFLQHDYNQAAAVNLDNEEFDTEHYKSAIKAFTDRNKALFDVFSTGKVDDKGTPVYDKDGNPVYATAEETRLAYIALETEIGQMKSELTALYNEAAAAEALDAVQAEIDKLTAIYEGFVAQLADCHTPVIEEYQDDVDVFKANIDALQALLNVEATDNTVLLYKDENIKTAEIIKASVATLETSITNDEKPYDVNDSKYIELLGQLNSLTEELNRVKAAVDEYDNKKPTTLGVDDQFDTNEDGKYSDDEKFTLYADYQYAYISYQIAKNKTWLEEQNDAYALLENSAFVDDSKKPTYSKAVIQSNIATTEIECSHYNATNSIPSITKAKNSIEHSGYTDADKKELMATCDSLKTAIDNVEAYELNANSGYVYKDIDGIEIWREVDGEQVSGKSVVYMEEYPTIMAKIAELAEKVADLEQAAIDKSWIKGDVDHNGKITVADYDAVRQMVLELIEYKETDAMFYAADVNEDGLVNIGDVTQIGSKIMENKPFQSVAGASSVAMAKGMAAGMPTYGNLALTADGSGLAQTIKVAVDSRLGFVGGQFDVVLPKGVKLVSVASSSHDALMGEVDGAFRVLVSNLENTEIVNGQAFVELNVEVTSDYDGGGIEVRNVKFADADGTVFNLAKSSISTPTSLTNLTTTEKIQSKVYTVGGMLMNKVKKGINIIVNSDGTTKKQAIE